MFYSSVANFKSVSKSETKELMQLINCHFKCSSTTQNAKSILCLLNMTSE